MANVKVLYCNTPGKTLECYKTSGQLPTHLKFEPDTSWIQVCLITSIRPYSTENNIWISVSRLWIVQAVLCSSFFYDCKGAGSFHN